MSAAVCNESLAFQVETALEKLLQQTHVKAKAKADFMMARRDQELECRRLRNVLAGLREERNAAQEEEARVVLIAEARLILASAPRMRHRPPPPL